MMRLIELVCVLYCGIALFVWSIKLFLLWACSGKDSAPKLKLAKTALTTEQLINELKAVVEDKDTSLRESFLVSSIISRVEAIRNEQQYLLEHWVCLDKGASCE